MACRFGRRRRLVASRGENETLGSELGGSDVASVEGLVLGGSRDSLLIGAPWFDVPCWIHLWGFIPSWNVSQSRLDV